MEEVGFLAKIFLILLICNSEINILLRNKSRSSESLSLSSARYKYKDESVSIQIIFEVAASIPIISKRWHVIAFTSNLKRISVNDETTYSFSAEWFVT